MTDYLAEIAARTVWCLRLELLESEVDEGFGDGNPEGPCSLCKGLEEVLDPRFEGLRQSCTSGSHLYPVFIDDCPGYTVNRDLAVLLACARPLLYGMMLVLDSRESRPDGWYCVIEEKSSGICHTHDGVYNTALKAAAKAVHEWLEAEKKVTA